MKLMTLLAAVAATTTACAASATETECEALTVGVVPQHVTFHFDQSIHQLSQRAGVVGRAAILGLFTTMPRVEREGCHFTVRFESHLYVARELARNQCAFDHVLRHEQEHSTIWASGQAQLAERIQVLVNAGVYPVEAAMRIGLMDAYQKNREHDSPEEYARNSTVCDGWIDGVVNTYRKGSQP